MISRQKLDVLLTKIGDRAIQEDVVEDCFSLWFKDSLAIYALIKGQPIAPFFRASAPVNIQPYQSDEGFFNYKNVLITPIIKCLVAQNNESIEIVHNLTPQIFDDFFFSFYKKFIQFSSKNNKSIHAFTCLLTGLDALRITRSANILGVSKVMLENLFITLLSNKFGDIILDYLIVKKEDQKKWCLRTDPECVMDDFLRVSIYQRLSAQLSSMVAQYWNFPEIIIDSIGITNQNLSKASDIAKLILLINKAATSVVIYEIPSLRKNIEKDNEKYQLCLSSDNIQKFAVYIKESPYASNRGSKNLNPSHLRNLHQQYRLHHHS